MSIKTYRSEDVCTIAKTVVGGEDLSALGGIRLSDSQISGAHANTLDCYKEYIWTPYLRASTSNPTVSEYLTQNGNYTLIGRLCHIQCELVTLSGKVSGGSGGIRFNLPFTPTKNCVLPVGMANITFPAGCSMAWLHAYNDGYGYLTASGSGVSDTAIPIESWATDKSVYVKFSGIILL
jgi:hypothetical protein